VQSRAGEERHFVSPTEELRAVYSSPIFWTTAFELPRNDLTTQIHGRPALYPDWLLFLLTCGAAISGIGTRGAAVALMADARLWRDFVEDIDDFVPEGFTRVADLRPSRVQEDTRERPRAGILTTATNATPLVRREDARKNQSAKIPVMPPPANHHLDYFALRWRGLKKGRSGLAPAQPGDAWYGVRARVIRAARAAAITQVQSMGQLHPTKPFQYRKPDPSQFVGFDGVVFPMSRRRHSSASCDEHVTGGGSTPVYGSKYTIASTRTLGSYGSRMILDFQHNGGAQSSDPDEAKATVTMAKDLSRATARGMKGIVVDSVIRCRAVSDLERNWVTVVNNPVAASNPSAKTGQRRGPGRREKGYLRTVATHADSNGVVCEHGVYFYGGVPVEGITGQDGRLTVVPLEILEYEQRGQAVRRQYFRTAIKCTLAGDFEARVPLFHTDATSNDPDVNYGEVARVFPPNTHSFTRLYGMRNDTESRHTELKARLHHLPADVAGQELRLLGAMIVINSVAWQLHLQSARRRNVLDDTA